MADKLEVGLKLKAMYSGGEFYPATVLEISASKKRAKTPVKVNFTGYGDESNVWVGIDISGRPRRQLRARRLPVHCLRPRL